MGKAADNLHLRFGLRHLFAATTSCAVAFAILRGGKPESLLVTAGCVPVLWFGIGMLYVGDLLTIVDSLLLRGLGVLFMSIGFFIGIFSFLIGSVVLLCASAVALLKLLHL